MCGQHLLMVQKPGQYQIYLLEEQMPLKSGHIEKC